MTEKGKNKLVQRAALYAVFPAVMEESNSSKMPCVWAFADSGAVVNGVTTRSGRRTMETWVINRRALPYSVLRGAFENILRSIRTLRLRGRLGC